MGATHSDLSKRSLESLPMSVIHDQVAINDWYVVAHKADVVRGRLSPVKLLEQELVLWRSEGALHAWRDQCPHRGTRLSLGVVER